MPESTGIEAILRTLVEAMEQREAAEPDLPEWEATARLREAEANLLRLYRARPHQLRHDLAAIEIRPEAEPFVVEVA